MAVAVPRAYDILTGTRDLTYEEWLEYRRLGIGGSDAAALVGLNKWSSPMTVYADKLGLRDETITSEAMRQGTDLEAYVAQRFSEATGKKVRRENHILRSVEHPVMLANVDRMVVGEKAGLECKTTSFRGAADWEKGEVPDHYYVQVQHYMAVTGLPKWYLAVLVFGTHFYWYEIERNEADIAALIEAEEAFWHDHVETKIPPDPDGTTASAAVIRGMYKGNEAADEVILVKTKSADLDRYMELKKLQDDAKGEMEEIAQKIQMEMGDATVAHAQGYKVTFKPVSSTRLDTKKIKAEQPDIYDTYGKTSTSRRFTVKEMAG